MTKSQLNRFQAVQHAVAGGNISIASACREARVDPKKYYNWSFFQKRKTKGKKVKGKAMPVKKRKRAPHKLVTLNIEPSGETKKDKRLLAIIKELLSMIEEG